MNTRKEAKELLHDMMEKIENDKDNLSDGHYLELCDKVKFLYNELKNRKFDDDDSDDDDSDDDDNSDTDDEDDQVLIIPIELLIGGYVQSINISESFSDTPLNLYNKLMVGICEKIQEPRNFKCLCGQCIETNNFSNHIKEEIHIQNFKVPTIEEYEDLVDMPSIINVVNGA